VSNTIDIISSLSENWDTISFQSHFHKMAKGHSMQRVIKFFIRASHFYRTYKFV